jgi:putative peptide zinc metalloprotease protein
MGEQVFSNSWHIISGLQVALLSTVTVQKQNYRGTEYYILRDKFNNKFFRIKPEAYKFIVKLNTEQTVEAFWEEYLEKYPLITPTQDELVKLLSQLHLNNLLYFKNRVQSEEVFERYRDHKAKMIKSKLMGFLFIKIPLFNPDRFLETIQPLSKIIFSRVSFFIWLFFILYALKIVVDNSDKVSMQAQGMLAPSNLIYLYVTLFILKILHELGHAMICKKYGGPVHTLGLMFLVFTPLPYMDASSSWGFRNKWHRALVGSAGMVVELFIAAIATIIWVNTGDGFVHSLSFNVMIIGSVSSLIFNANPLLKLDAYYILSDVLEIPNLLKQSNQQFLYYFKKYLFKVPHVFPMTYEREEAFWLVTYAVLSYLYRLLVSLAIMFFVADQIFIVGVLVALMSLYMWIIKPLYGLFQYLSSSPELNFTRKRAIFISASFISIVLVSFLFVPVPNSIRASGVLYADQFSSVYTSSDGILKEVFLKNGQRVEKGQTIAILSNKSLDIELEILETNLEKTLALELQAQKDIADLKPLKKRVELLRKKIMSIKEKQDELKVFAETSGIWVSKEIQAYKENFLKNTTHLGDIIPQKGFRFIAVVPQEKAYDLFDLKKLGTMLKLHGVAAKEVQVKDVTVIPYKQNILPSAVLGWLGGGEIKVSTQDQSGKTAVEAFFEIRANVMIEENNPELLHHRSGILRIELEKSSLFSQFSRHLEQLVQRKYQI